MAAAAPVIRARANNPRLMKEIGAWVDAFEQLGHAGQHAVAALEENNAREAATRLVQATQALAAMDGILPPPQPGRTVVSFCGKDRFPCDGPRRQ